MAMNSVQGASENPVSLKPMLLVLDFDGTVCIGDGPVWSYAEAALAEALILGTITGAEAERVRGALRDFLAGDAVGDWFDGYTAVDAMLSGHLSAEQRQRAYRASRDALADGRVSVSAPDGLADLLERIGGWVERVVVTNAPENGVRQMLQRAGLAPFIDRIVAEARKPAGWPAILPDLVGDRPVIRCMAVGDIWENDLAAPHDRGFRTALIDRFGHIAGLPDFRSIDFAGLFDDIAAWAGAAQPAGSADGVRG